MKSKRERRARPDRRQRPRPESTIRAIEDLAHGQCRKSGLEWAHDNTTRALVDSREREAIVMAALRDLLVFYDRLQEGDFAWTHAEAKKMERIRAVAKWKPQL